MSQVMIAAINRIVFNYSSDENIEYIDDNVYVVVGASGSKASSYSVERRVVVLTNSALYLIQELSQNSWLNELKKQDLPLTKPQPTSFFLKRRIALTSDAGGLENICMSKYADNTLILRIKPTNKRPVCNKDNWKNDNKCSTTGE